MTAQFAKDKTRILRDHLMKEKETRKLEFDNFWAEYRKYLSPSLYAAMSFPDLPRTAVWTTPPVPNAPYHKTYQYEMLKTAALLE